MRFFKTIHTLFIVGILAGTNVSNAFPIATPGTEGLPVIAGSTDDIIATYQGNSAAYSNDLYLMLDAAGNPADDGDLTNDLYIFNNHRSAVGSTANLGSFAIGTELLFRLHVNNTNRDYFTGAASLNPDEEFHARVQENWMPDLTLVSFEDLYHGPFHYNDLSFSFANTVTTPPAVPEPATLALIGLGLIGIIFGRYKAL